VATPPGAGYLASAVVTHHAETTDALVQFIGSQPGLARKILDEHIRDASGDCAACSGYRQVRYPCGLAWHAAEVLKRHL